VQVRQAVELLVGAFGRIDVRERELGGRGLRDVDAHEVYRGAVSVMMRIVFVMFAEERRLLPVDNEWYAEAYSAGRLCEALEKQQDLENSTAAWQRLLALFRVVHGGVDHPLLSMRGHDGSLFDPDALPWLPGNVDDRTVLHMLRSVLFVGGGRAVSFRTLDVEQIGYVYEGLLSFEGFRARDVTVGLIGRGGVKAAVPLSVLESLAPASLDVATRAARLAQAYKATKRLAPACDEARTKLLRVTGGDYPLAERLLPFAGIIRTDLRDLPVVILPGGLFVAESALRRTTGTHYTPRFLAEEVVENALEPLVYEPGPLQTANKSRWKRKSKADILALKVADIAMGSGVFLVAAARYLAGHLIEAGEHVSDAHREIIENCLYGVDINPMAVEMAKLSLWLVSRDSVRPFTFLDDRLVAGDSLLGLGNLGPGNAGPVTGIAEKVQTGDLDQARACLDLPGGVFERNPLHWPLEFPEVFDKGGFDAIVGNPPFLGGSRITGPLGTAYREYLVNVVANGVRGGGKCDLVAYFLLRAISLLNENGQTGLIATNTLAQGDTREVGLDQAVCGGAVIRRAIKSRPWPSPSAALEFCVVWISRAEPAPESERVADGVVTEHIDTSLDAATGATGRPHRLAANLGVSHIGSYVYGSGFTMEPAEAARLIRKDPRNADVLFPYLNGHDLNSRPDASASRMVIDFRDWSLDRASGYPDCLDRLRTLVKPEREKVKRKIYRERWWQYAENQMSMRRAVAGLDRVIAITQTSRTMMPMLVTTKQVLSHMLVVIAKDDAATLGLLSSSVHYFWVVKYSATMKTDLRYIPSDVFDTFPLPCLGDGVRSCGERLDGFRRDVMTARRLGLTATYNLVFDPRCCDADIEDLRRIHRSLDEAVCRAYRWDDLAGRLDHGFHRVGAYVRYIVGPATRREILARLLRLNHAEVLKAPSA
jgi:methylase of polypeptide subunit release factors